MPGIDWSLLQNNPAGQQARGFTYADQVAQSAAARQAGSQFAGGDYGGATSTLAQAGNLPAAQQMQQYGQKSGQAGLAYVASALPVFQQIAQAHAGDPDKGAAALGDAFDHIAPEAKMATGVSDQQLATFRSLLTSDPQGAIARMQAQMPVAWQKAGDDLVATGPGGRILNTYSGTKITTAGPGQTVVQTPAEFNGQPVGGQVTPQPQPQPQPAAQPQPQPIASNAPLGIRSNNPGNLMPAGQEETYTNMTAGILAASNNLDTYGKQGINTVSGIVNRWAPAAAGNNTQAYVQDIAQRLGVDPNQPLNLSDPNVKGALLEAMFQHENGQQPQIGGQQQPSVPQGAQPQAQPQQPGGAKVLYSGGPVWRAPTAEELKQYPGATQINAATGQVKYPPMSAAGAGATDAQIQPYVDMLKAGGTLPSYLARNPALYSRILDGAKAQGISMSDILANQANRKATAATFQSVNTRYAIVQTQEQSFQKALTLAYSLAQKAGPQGGGTLINGFRNYLKTGVVGDPATGAFINAVNTAMNEYGKIIEGSTGNAGSSISARADANSMLSGADNLPAFVEKMKVLQADAGFKIAALKEQHDTLLSALDSIGSPDKSGQGQQPSPTDGLPILSPAAAMKAAPGTKFRGTDGVVRVRK